MKIGYYAHHHGTGHCRQADKLAAHLNSLREIDALDSDALGSDALGSDAQYNDTLTVFTSLPEDSYQFNHISDNNIVRLSAEDETPADLLPGRAGTYWQPECMHYSPIGNKNIQQRSLTLLLEVQRRQIELLIVDLSVEIALLCRAASIPYLYVRLPGDRDDTPHISAFEGAIGLLAPYPKALESATTPKWIRQKTIHLGFLFKPNPEQQLSKPQFISYLNKLAGSGVMPSKPDPLPLIITVIKGFGGHHNIDAKLPELREIMPTAFIISLGPIESHAKSYVDLAIQVDSVLPFLQHSDLLVMACGLNAIGEVCQYDTPLLVIPDERPHAEQQRMAESLIATGRATDLTGLKRYLHESQQPKARVDNTSYDTIMNTNYIGKSDMSEPTSKLSNQDSVSDILASLRPCHALVNAVAKSNSLEFAESIGGAGSIKQWFYDWLYPRLSIQPEKQNRPSVPNCP